jgi:ABC-type multidrug transport system ATPase subunit
MAEAEELCERIAIVKAGRIIALDTPKISAQA